MLRRPLRHSCVPALCAIAATCTLLLVACSRSPVPSTDPVRLIDIAGDATVENTPPLEEVAAHSADWSFADGASGWQTYMGIEGFGVEDGALVGRTAMPDPIMGPAPSVAVALPDDLPEDALWAIEVRARISDGANLTARFARGEELSVPAAFGNPMGIFRTPLQAGEETHDYSIRPSNPVTLGQGPGFLVITPSDVAGAEFAIERVQLVLRKEHLNSVPSGPSWQGLSEIYRETMVSRAPETLHFDVSLPAEPFLEFAVGTIESQPTTFHVEVSAEGAEPMTWSQEVTEADTWQKGSVDLASLAGQTARISLRLESAADGSLGFWGAPAVRSGAPVVADAQGATAPQGVLLILTDTLRRDHLEAWGYERETAPTIARLASEGVRFEDAISQSTWTKVSVPAIQTGLYPTTHTIKALPDRLPASADTLAEQFREAGYATFGLLSIPFVGRMTNLHQGYETLHEPGAMRNLDDSTDQGDKSSLHLVPHLLDWLDDRGDSKWFALLHIDDAHSPFRPSPEHELLFSEEGEMDQLDEWIETAKAKIQHPLMQQFGMPRREEIIQSGLDPEEFVRLEADGMDSSILGMDQQIAKVVAKLEELGLRDKVLVALVSDHGTELLEHDDHFHGHTAYGELNRIPMLLWGPGFLPSTSVPATVQAIDLMPSMLDVAQLPIPERVQGASLRPLWDDPSTPWRRPAITELPWNFRGPVVWSLISDGWKLLRVGPLDEEPAYHLFDHEADPLSLTDLAADQPDKVEQLARLMENWRAQATEAMLDDLAANATLDAAELERLRSLGYVQ